MLKKMLWLFCYFCFFTTTCVNAQVDARPNSWNQIKHVVVIILENTNASDAARQPYLKSLITQGAYLTKYFAVTHPSQPNYLAQIAGSTFDVRDDSNVTIDKKHLGDLLVAKNLTWKTYAEDYPGDCYLGEKSGNYVRKHVPFLSFKSVQSQATECNKIVTANHFFTDLNANQLPTFALYIPNLQNDGHDTGVAFADKWLQGKFKSILNNPTILKDTLFIITFDEDAGRDNNVYAAFIGAGIKIGIKSSIPYTHYSFLKTIEAIFQLGTLGANDEKAKVIADIWLP